MLDRDASTVLPMNATNIRSAVIEDAATLQILRLRLVGRDRALFDSGPGS